MESQTLISALRYLKLGFSIIPLGERSKTPAIKWEEFQSRRANEGEVAAWFTGSARNIGIVTGSISGLVVVDVDSPEGLESVKTAGLVSPVGVYTGRGRQFYFRHPGGHIGNRAKVWPGVDIRGDGGFVVAAPSIHPSGKRYVLFPVGGNLGNLPIFPTEKLPKRQEEGKAANQAGWIQTALASLTEGNRNDTFTKLVGKLHRDGWAADAIFVLLGSHADRAGFPAAELQTIINSVGRYPQPDKTTAHTGYPGTKVDSEPEPLHIYNFRDSEAEYIERKTRLSKVAEFETGYPKIDRLCNGLHRQEILTVAARPGIGKTNWLIGASKHMCQRHRTVLYFSTEMAFDAVWDRYIALDTKDGEHKAEQFKLCAGNVPDLGRVEDAIAQSKPDVFIFDHINFVEDEPKKISAWFKGLKALAIKFDMPGIVAAQLNRQADWVDPKTKEKIVPRMSMIKGSGSIEEVSAQVLLLSEINAGEEQTELIGVLDKNRYGEKDICAYLLKKKPYRMVEV